MREGNFIDTSTKSTVVKFNVQSVDCKIHKYASSVRIFKRRQRGSKSNSRVLIMDVYDGMAGSFLLALEIFMVCWIIHTAYSALADSAILARSEDFFAVMRTLQPMKVIS